ncbi:MAG: RNA-binding protein [Elusimicrobia bacterium]|nr:RNA-binding protein [Elusimicrobiota bacterium]
MSKKLYVGNLPFDTTEEQLRTAFTAHGQVESVKIITDKFTGRSKGFGFVEMADDTAAQQAITTLNKSRLGERELTVNEARPLESRDGGGRGGFGNRGGGGGARNRSFNRY